MAVFLKKIFIDNFKSYNEPQWIDVSTLNVFMGANSSGKSTALQTLLTIKQTIECNSPNIDLLLSGKFVTLGDFQEVINDSQKGYIKIGVALEYQSELGDGIDTTCFIWTFKERDNITVLSDLEVVINEENICLSKRDDQKYAINFNERSTEFLIDLKNLMLGSLYVQYDEIFNNIFQQLLNELLMGVLRTKKVEQVNKSEMVAISGTEKFYLLLMGGGLNRIKNRTNKDQKIIKEIIDLIIEYSKLQFAEYERTDNMPRILKETILLNALSECSPEDMLKIKQIIDKYREKMAEYKAVPNDEKTKNLKYSRVFNDLSRAGKDEKENRDSDIANIMYFSMVYRRFIQDIIKNIFYIGPIREKPQGLYNIGFESIPKYVGTTGAYFASVLLRENKVKKYILPDNEIDTITLEEAVDEWANHLNIASEISVEQKNSFGFSVSVKNIQYKKSDIMNVGIGTSQVLPVLISGLLSEKKEILMFEQPELHLHPYSQSRLADFFVMLSKNGRKIFVETHSEYMILRLRYHVLVGNIREDQIAINFFQNKNGTKIKKGKLNSYGNLEYPEDFKDETQELLNSLIAAAMTKGKKDDKKCID